MVRYHQAGLIKFFSRRPISQFYLRARSGTLKKGAQNQSAHPIETQLETLLFALITKIAFTDFIFQCFPQKTFTIRLLRADCSFNVKKWNCSSKNNFLIMLKVWDFTKKRLHNRYLDNNLQKIFRRNIFQNGTGQIILIIVLMVGLWLKLQMEIVY